MGQLGIYVLIATAAALAWLYWRWWRRLRTATDRRRAMADFREQSGELASKFLQAAAATGKPRGLSWKACEFVGPVLFAVDPAARLYALAPVSIGFEAIEGGGMEDVEAVGNLRLATAVFVVRDGQWSTDGRAVFNLDPPAALRHFQASLRPVEAQAPA
jgi:hypothetical protein